MRTDMRKIVSVLAPVLLHQAVTLAVSFLLGVCAAQYGLKYDGTLAVLLGNLAVIPLAARMYRSDGRNQIIPDETGRTPKSAGPAPGIRAVFPEAADERVSAPGLSGWRRPKQVLFGLLCFAAGGMLNIAWSSALNLLHIQAHFSNQTQEQLFAASLPVQFVGLGIIAPVAEELIFRGLTYRRMRRIFPLWAAVVLSALLFAVYHGNPIQMIFAFPLAVVLALIYEHGKLFIFPVLFHVGSNLTAIFLQIMLRG